MEDVALIRFLDAVSVAIGEFRASLENGTNLGSVDLDLEPIYQICRELDSRVSVPGGRFEYWLDAIVAFAERDYGHGLSGMNVAEYEEVYRRLSDQLKAAPAGAGGATVAGGAAVAPKDPVEDGDGIPD